MHHSTTSNEVINLKAQIIGVRFCAEAYKLRLALCEINSIYKRVLLISLKHAFVMFNGKTDGWVDFAILSLLHKVLLLATEWGSLY